MKSIFCLCSLFFLSAAAIAQDYQSADTIAVPVSTENIYTKRLFSDSLASSFFIAIKKEVKPHKHLYHSEHVYFLQGEGIMQLGNKFTTVKKGDVTFIPKNTIHGLKVTSAEMVKIISVQSPYSDGTDRVFTDPVK